MTETVGVAEAERGSGVPRATATTAVTLATQMCRFDDVLGAAAADRLLEEGCHALMAEVRGQGAGAEAVVPPTWRCADQTARFPSLAAVVTRLSPMVMTMLGVPVTDARVSFGFTMHNELPADDRQQEPPVRDSAGAGDPRRIAFLYHLHRRPRGFTGGQTRIYDTTVREGHPGIAESFRDVQPDHDSLVFFPADAWYQVRPVNSPSAKLLDSRFAFHGWLGTTSQ
ncbi:2OG-Fe(II) oxygenase [Streptomyces sp. I05A-00742]|uniref:2OG-Fe(II) oxygenase n=1 Tax=Streptomyces sp. I05A-00742 TaxID=2732853 RepID=UPI00148928E8|nr:2OG-Fe(II) oxygenase [Streptomyces sp. I05A-00742]